MRLSGLVSHRRRRTFMGNGSGVSRGDRNRNARLARLRVLVPSVNAIVGIDLADRKQMIVDTERDWKVLARKTVRCHAWDLGAGLEWASKQAAGKGFAGVTVACEPTGHRWRVLGQLAAEREMPFVCVQPMLTSWARRSEDLTFDKTDEKDAVLIARLTAQLRCYIPEPVDETWARMTGVLDELLLTDLVTSITGLSAIGAAAILAETGDPNRFSSARALVKHAGLAPREKLSGTFKGRTKLTGQGRPSLRLAAWRAVWGAQRANPVYAARFTHLTTREQQQTHHHPSPSRDRRGDPATA